MNILEVALGGTGTGLAVFFVGSMGLLRMRETERERARAALALLTMLLVAVITAWIASPTVAGERPPDSMKGRSGGSAERIFQSNALPCPPG